MKKKYDLYEKRLEVLLWAHDHELIIDPIRGMDWHIQCFANVGRCPCDKTGERKTCPCPQSILDIAETGHCLCSFFWDEEKFFEKMKKEKEERDEQERAKKGQRVC